MLPWFRGGTTGGITWRGEVRPSREVHNLEIAGSNPAATTLKRLMMRPNETSSVGPSRCEAGSLIFHNSSRQT